VETQPTVKSPTRIAFPMYKTLYSTLYAVWERCVKCLGKTKGGRKLTQSLRSGMYLAGKIDKLEPNTWYFAFETDNSSSNILPWYITLFMKKDSLAHILAFTHIGDEQTIIYNPVFSGLVTHLVNDHADVVAAKLKRGEYDKVVKLIYNKRIRSISHTVPNAVPGCVTFAKNLVGSSDWVFTPLQFYNWLIEKGGMDISQEDAIDILKEEYSDYGEKGRQFIS